MSKDIVSEQQAHVKNALAEKVSRNDQIALEWISRGLLRVDFDTGNVYAPSSRCGLKPVGSKHDGYIRVDLQLKGVKLKVQAHRVVMLAHLGKEIPYGLQINHKNGVKDDNRLENLEISTASGNIKHAYEAGLNKPRRGEKHHNAILTEGEVAAIRVLRDRGIRLSVVSDWFGISIAQVSQIARGVSWK